jgi:transglutaminase-like putative cysteine protease
VEFPDRNMPSTSQMYWRGGVLWRGDGLTWTRGALRVEAERIPLTGPAIRQQIVMEPHGGRWIFALDRPTGEIPKTILEAGGYLQSIKPINKSLRYTVLSRPENRESTLFPEHHAAARQTSAHVSPRIRALVASWAKAGENERAVVDSALRYFRTENFSYTLTPGRYSGDALDQFLFVRRTGFCEHYAGAFASLMRIAGIPARVIIGFHGGEFNALGGYVIVRQCDAHAWCEVWISGQGWARVDPVDAIAPGRIQSGLTSFLESRAIADDPEKGIDSTSFTSRFLSRFRLIWDSLNYQWDLRVLSFDEESQRSLFSFLGFGEPSWLSPLPWIAVAGGIGFIAFSMRLRRPWPPEDVAVREYGRFCKKLAASGLPRPVFEGVSDFTERAARHFPAHGALIRKIGALYVQLRYARSSAGTSQNTAPALADFISEVKAFQKEKL